MPAYEIGDKFYNDAGGEVITEIIFISPDKDWFGNWIYFIKETEEGSNQYPKYLAIQGKQIDDFLNPL